MFCTNSKGAREAVCPKMSEILFSYSKPKFLRTAWKIMEDDATIAQLVNLRCLTRTMALFKAQCGTLRRGCPTSGKCHREHQRHQTVKLRRWKSLEDDWTSMWLSHSPLLCIPGLIQLLQTCPEARGVRSVHRSSGVKE